LASATLRETLEEIERHKQQRAEFLLWKEIEKIVVVPVEFTERDLAVGDYISWGYYYWDSYGIFRTVNVRRIHVVDRATPRLGIERRTTCKKVIPLYKPTYFAVRSPYPANLQLCKYCLIGGRRDPSKKKIAQSES